MPNDLAALLADRFPQFRLPLISDSLPEDIDYQRAHGGNGCLLVAKADLDGDRVDDFAVGLAPVAGEGAALVVFALRRGDEWFVSPVHDGVPHINRLYLGSVPPKRWKRTEILDGPVHGNERKSLRCAHNGVVLGATESTGIVYCYVNRQWLYVWVSD